MCILVHFCFKIHMRCRLIKYLLLFFYTCNTVWFLVCNFNLINKTMIYFFMPDNAKMLKALKTFSSHKNYSICCRKRFKSYFVIKSSLFACCWAWQFSVLATAQISVVLSSLSSLCSRTNQSMWVNLDLHPFHKSILGWVGRILYARGSSMKLFLIYTEKITRVYRLQKLRKK